MKSLIPQMKLVETGGEFADLILTYSWESLGAEAVRIVNDPFIKHWQEKTFQNF